MIIKLLPKQLDFISSKSKVTVYGGGRGIGKSFVASLLAVTNLKEGKSGLLISPIYNDLVSVIVAYMIEFLEESKTPYTHNKSQKVIKVRNAVCHYRSAENKDGKGIRGLSNLSFLIVDEAALVTYDVYKIARACMRGANVRDPQTYLVSTPKGKSSWFYAVAFKDGTKLIMGSSKENTFLDSSFYADLMETYDGEFARQELEGEFIDNDSAAVFTQAEWDMFTARSKGMGSQVVIGVDVAAGGDDSACTLIRGTEIVNIVARKTTTDISTLIDLCKQTLGGVEPNYIVVDSTGIGTFAPTELGKQWPNATVIAVNFGAKANKKGYALRRDEIHFDLKRKISLGLTISAQISPATIQQLQKQFFATEYGINNNRDFKLIPKAEVKSKIGCSPDILDSICLAASLDAESVLKQRELDARHTHLAMNRPIFNNRK